MPNYTFGSYLLNNMSAGLGATLLAKNSDMPVVKPVIFPIARRDGMKKSGEQVDGRQIDVLLKVIGTSRTDLISRIDTLQQALSLRSQNLVVHEDGRYYQSVDCLSAGVRFAAGNGVVAADVPISFKANDPYAYAASSSSYDTGVQTLTLTSSLWTFPAISLTGGGTYYSYPLFHLVNKTSTGTTTLSAGLTSGTMYTSISVASTPFTAATGDQITITHGGTTQTLTTTASVALYATSVAVSSFTASASYISSDAVAKVTAWTALSINQAQDAQTLNTSATTLVPLPVANADYTNIQCDPAQGLSIMTNASGKYSDPIGTFPTLEPGTTTITISIASASAVSAECMVSWNARYLS